jgi:TonB family protein
VRRLITLLLGLLCAAQSVGADAPAGKTPPSPDLPPIESAQALDLIIENLHRSNWVAHGQLEHITPAEHANAERLFQQLLIPAREARAQALSAAARAATTSNDQSKLQATLGEAHSLLAGEVYRWSLFEFWVASGDAFGAHAERVQRLVSQLPADAGPPAQKFIDDAMKNFDSATYDAITLDDLPGLQAAMPRLAQDYHDVLNVYNAQRGRLAARLSAQNLAQGKQPTPVPRATSCPPGAAHGSGREKPAMDMKYGDLEAFYPPELKRLGFEGFVLVQVWLSSSGCAEKVAVYESSGLDEMDQSALQWAQQETYFPAEHEHQPIESTFRFRVKFALAE